MKCFYPHLTAAVSKDFEPFNRTKRVMKLFFSLTLLVGPLLAFTSPSKGKDQVFEPMREVAIISTPDGFLPKRLAVFKGEEVTIFFTSILSKGGCFVLPSHRIFLSSQSGKVSSTKVTFTTAGRYEYYCPDSREKMTGVITVFQRKAEVKNRAPSSVGGGEYPSGQWMPKEN